MYSRQSFDRGCTVGIRGRQQFGKVSRILSHMILEQNGLVSNSDMFEEVTQTLSPKDRRSLRSIDEALRVHVLTEFGKNACHPIDSAGAVHVSNKIDRGRFHRRDQEPFRADC